jgi:hypothetical protein
VGDGPALRDATGLRLWMRRSTQLVETAAGAFCTKQVGAFSCRALSGHLHVITYSTARDATVYTVSRLKREAPTPTVEIADPRTVGVEPSLQDATGRVHPRSRRFDAPPVLNQVARAGRLDV